VKRLFLLIVCEFRMSRTSIPIHLLAILQPTLLFLLMAIILVHPTFDMNVIDSNIPESSRFISAMDSVRSPIGEPYIKPILVDEKTATTLRQVITIEKDQKKAIAHQRFALIDANLVKNYRNRLTATLLHLWNEDLGSKSVTIREHPTVGRDLPYTAYFGLGLLPMAVMLATILIGSTFVAQEFEDKTVLELKMAFAPIFLILCARLVRLLVFGCIAGFVLVAAIGLSTNVWPLSFLNIGAIFLIVGIIGGSLGTIIGLMAKRLLPCFISSLVVTITCWVFGSSFGPAESFGGNYELISKFVPNTYAVKMLFPNYFGLNLGSAVSSAVILALFCALFLWLSHFVYKQQIMKER